MSRLEALDGTNWEGFLAAPAAFLMLGKSDCVACQQWTEDLLAFLASDQEWQDVRFGKLLLDRPGLISFKKAHPWVSGVSDLPYNVLFVDGAPAKQYAGGGVDRMLSRLTRALRESEAGS